MVSFWPWRGDTSSTASFEKTLSTLSNKITVSQTRLDSLRTSSRRIRVLVTLYLSFAYLVCAIVLFLVVGYQNLGPWEWSGLAGGPVFMYAIRTLHTSYCNLRINSGTRHLNELQKQRADTIQKLKDATKYDSTLQLIEKYGGEKKNKDDSENGPGDRKGAGKSKQNPKASNRVPFVPPPTANIQRPPVSSPGARGLEPGAEFAPNAEAPQPVPQSQQQQIPGPPSTSSLQSHPRSPQAQPPQQYSQFHESHWYDRIFDVLLGEDETLPKNRIVLLCNHCRLVNGQAPPGIKTLADVGMWRCMGCGQMNGETKEEEGRRVVREVLEQRDAVTSSSKELDATHDTGLDENVLSGEAEHDDESAAEDVVADDAPAAAVRRRPFKGEK